MISSLSLYRIQVYECIALHAGGTASLAYPMPDQAWGGRFESHIVS